MILKIEKAYRGALLVGVLFVCLTTHIYADVVYDGVLGPARNLSGPNFMISEIDGQRRGSNLFHSFSRFNLQSGENAIFLSSSSVDNILARITGGDVSIIDGGIQAGANLYFINPAGIVFGPDAELNISGSLFVTTADYVRLDDGNLFNVDLNRSTLLSSSPPAAFGFLDNDYSPISLRNSDLRLANGQSISLVGGAVEAAFSAITVDGGAINLVGVGFSGEASLSGFEIAADTPDALSTVSLINTTLSNQGSEGGAHVFIKAGRFVVTRASEIMGNASSSNVANSTTVIDAMEFQLDDGSSLSGNVEVSAGQVEILDGGRINGVVNLENPGNEVSIQTQSLIIDGQNSGQATGVFAGSQQLGSGGDIFISAEQVSIINGGQISASTATSGSAGAINIQADRLQLSVNAQIVTQTVGRGGAGDISINSGVVRMSDQSVIRSSSSSINGLAGSAGSINLNVRDSLQLIRGSAITTEATTATGGDVFIDAGGFVFLSGSEITTSVVSGTGDGGNISIAAPFVALDGSRVIAQAFGGRGGGINISTNLLLARAGSVIDASSELGIGGNIIVDFLTENIDDGFAEPLDAFLKANDWLKVPCAKREGSQSNHLVISGRDGGYKIPTDLEYAMVNFSNPRSYTTLGEVSDMPLYSIAGINKRSDFWEVNMSLRALRCQGG